MKTLSASMQAVLASRQFLAVDLYTLTLFTGDVLRYATADLDLAFGGRLFTARKSLFQRSRISWKVGVEVDELEIDCFPTASDTVAGLGFFDAMRRGYFDAADLVLERSFLSSWTDTSPGTVVLFSGRVSETAIGRSRGRLTARSYLELLDTQLPRNVFQPSCLNMLFDGACALDRARFAVPGTVAAVSGPHLFTASLDKPAGWFDQGSLAFTAGVNRGIARPIRSWDGTTVTLLVPPPVLPAPGDAFAAYPGCDKTQPTCAGKFANLANFRGQPYIPQPETAL